MAKGKYKIDKAEIASMFRILADRIDSCIEVESGNISINHGRDIDAIFTSKITDEISNIVKYSPYADIGLSINVRFRETAK